MATKKKTVESKKPEIKELLTYSISVDGEEWKVGPDFDDDGPTLSENSVRIQAPCGDETYMTKEVYLALRQCLDKYFGVKY